MSPSPDTPPRVRGSGDDTDQRRLRVAVIGYGNSAAWVHCPLLRAAPDFDLAVVVATSRRAEERARADGLPVVRTAGEAAAFAPEVAVVCVPDQAHETFSLEAIAIGAHVSVEKPFAPDRVAAERVRNAARRAGLRVSVFQNRRWDDDFLTAGALVRAGGLGDVTRYALRFADWRPEPGDGWRDRARSGQLDGKLADLGSHLVDQAVCLFGPVRDVFADVRRMRPGVTVNDDCTLLLRHVSGVVGEVIASAARPCLAPRIEVQGALGAYVSYGRDGQDTQLRDGVLPGSAEWGRRGREPGTSSLIRPGAGAVDVERVPGNWLAYYEQFREFVVRDGPAPVSMADALHVIEVLEAASASSARGTRVSLPWPSSGAAS
ncbi:Gfo/Idh/MocA family protein [Amycolatopsis acidicola]|uniref:Gfo/Idh/MocA family protein n=1 Tax=Amycolatopsis acidicola TaxID=2596893 RepID=UPI00140CF04B|nr:Gfo/Idh/MocA family oxidoreductase [Amycolatopsis acidicola]